MRDQNGNTGEFSMQDAMRMASSPAGQQLLQMLQKNGGQELQQALSMASAGDYTQAKRAIAALLQNPEAKKLLEQLGR